MFTPIDDFISNHDWDLLKRLNGWEIKKLSDSVVECELLAKDGEKYRVLFKCNGYPVTAPSVVFVNDVGSCLDGKAWPKGGTPFHDVVKPPPSCFLCMPLTREGLNHHREWTNTASAWNSNKHTLMDIINYVHRLLNSPEYNSRGD